MIIIKGIIIIKGEIIDNRLYVDIDQKLIDNNVLQIPFVWYRNGSSKVYYNPVVIKGKKFKNHKIRFEK